ncbi:unnamed protein product [Brassica oleracea]|uniref:(rape) hypothetical protein n=1 Tax=Brassica napus TaxID=3708 RepID=A0A816IP96_BRANA|nr:unnamed protein product [Brassica napus]
MGMRQMPLPCRYCIAAPMSSSSALPLGAPSSSPSSDSRWRWKRCFRGTHRHPEKNMKGKRTELRLLNL